MKESPLTPRLWETLAFARNIKKRLRRTIGPQPFSQITNGEMHEIFGQILSDGAWSCWNKKRSKTITGTATSTESAKLEMLNASVSNGFMLTPLGLRGDIIWVREQFKFNNRRPAGGIDEWMMDCVFRADSVTRFLYECDAPIETSFKTLADNKWRMAADMPRWASRFSFQIASIRVERLQAITEEEAKLEGVEAWRFNPMQTLTTGEFAGDSPFRSGFAYQWDTDQTGDRPTWKANPFVWVYELQPVRVYREPSGLSVDPIRN